MKLKASDIATFMCKQLIGEDLLLSGGFVPLSAPKQNSYSFANEFNEELFESLSFYDLLIITPAPAKKLTKKYGGISFLFSDNPKIDYVLCMHKFLPAERRSEPLIAESAVIGCNTVIGDNVSIGAYTVIEPGVVLGDGVRIGNSCTIKSGVAIGEFTEIGNNTIIGGQGLGYVEIEGEWILFPHVGNVLIGKRCYIGSNVTVARGTLGQTMICDGVKIDDQVHIAHNVTIHVNSLIVAGATICGSVEIGRNCWMGPNSCVKNGLRVGDNCFIGMSSCVTKSVPSGKKALGNPAKLM